MFPVTLFRRLGAFLRRVFFNRDQSKGNDTDTRRSERLLSAESLEPRILYSAAPAPAEAPAAEESPPAETTETPAPDAAPEAAPPAAEGDPGASDAAPPADGETTISADQGVELIDSETLSSSSPLSQESLGAIVEAAKQRWGDSGLTAEQSAALDGINYLIADLGPGAIAQADGNQITVDDDAGGAGWFVDSTPDADEEFLAATDGLLVSIPNSDASGHFDLLTALLHEQGHILGLGHEGAGSAGLMESEILPGERRLPEGNEANGAVPGSIDEVAYVGGTDWTRIDLSKISIAGEAPGDLSGGAVSVSADGNTVAIGARANDDGGTDAGHVRVYRLQAGIWTQLGADIDGVGAGDDSGRSVSLSADGNTIAIGASGPSNGTTSGLVRIYQLQGGAWNQVGADIAGEAAGDHSGFSVSFSSNGNIVAVGAWNNDPSGILSSAGHVRIYQYSAGSWGQLGSDIDGEAAGDLSGRSVSLSGDGSTVAIGATGNDGNGADAGSVRIFRLSGGVWSLLGGDIDGEAAGDKFGWSVSLSDDGNTVAVGSHLNSDNGHDAGHVRVLRYDNNSWSQLGGDIDGEFAGDYFGFSVSLSSDGNTVAIGAPTNSSVGTGTVRVLELQGNAWSQLGSDITTPGGSGGELFGWSVSLNSTGDTVVVGAPYDDGSTNPSNDNRGSAVAFRLEITNIAPVGNDDGFSADSCDGNALVGNALTNDTDPDSDPLTAAVQSGVIGSNGGLFSIASNGEVSFDPNGDFGVLAPGDTDTTTLTYTVNDPGGASDTATVTVTVTGVLDWEQLGLDIDGNTGDFSGWAVDTSADGNTVVASSYRNGDGKTRVFHWDGSSWAQLGTAILGESSNDQSGKSVAISDDGTSIVIGAYNNTGANGSGSGNARIYDWNGSAWVQRGSDIDGEASNDNSGWSVDISADGSTVVIGSPYADSTNGANSGHARVYGWSGSAWVQRGTDIDGEALNDRSGYSVSISSDGNTVIVGAYVNDGSGGNAGHIRVHEWDAGTSTWIQKGADIDGEAPGDWFGYSTDISADGNTIIVGAIYNTGNGNEAGHARVYYWTGVWTQKGLDIDGESAGDQAGYSVGISDDGNTVIVGAPLNDDAAGNSGHARVFSWDTGTMMWVKKGCDIDGEALGDESGWAVAMSADGNTIISGARYSDDNGTNSGHVRVFTFPVQTTSQPGDIDLSFGMSGKAAVDFSGFADIAEAIAVDSQGRILVAGSTNDGSEYDFALARFGANGILDTSFGVNGIVTTDFTGANEYGHSVAIDSTGSIVVAGYVQGGDPNFAVAKYDPSGVLDSSFGSGGKVITGFTAGSTDDVARSVIIDSANSIFVGGSATDASGNHFAIAKYSSAGVLDSSFGTGGKVTTDFVGSIEHGNSISFDSSGGLVVAGFARPASSNQFAVAKYDASGVLDSSFGTGGMVTTDLGGTSSVANSVTTDASGKILVAGISTGPSGGDFALVRYTVTGVPDPTFGSGGKVITDFGGGNDTANTVMVDSAGNIIVVGRDGSGDVAIARYTDSGALDSSFGSGGLVTSDLIVFATSATLDAAENIMVAGRCYDESLGTVNDFAVARFFNSASSETGPEITIEHDPTSDEITDGETATSGITMEGTDFGTVDVAAGLETRTFRIRNDGNALLTLSGTPVTLGGVGASQFTVTQPADLTLDPGQQETFTVSFDPSASGVHEATVTVASDDADEAIYDFSITGEGSENPTVVLELTRLGGDIDGEAAGDLFGGVVSFSADGNTLAIGANNNDDVGNQAGHVRVYDWSGSAWLQRGADIDGEAAFDGSGRSVSLSADGNTLAIGAPGNGDNGNSAGHVRVYAWSGSAWVKQGLDIDGEAAGDQSGATLSLSDDGSTLAIGALGNNGNGNSSGQVRVYDWSGSAWLQRGVDIDGEAADNFSGWSVSLSADGDTFAVGAVGNGDNGTQAGQVRIYDWSGSAWQQRGADINGSNSFDNFGGTVSLSSDGNTVAIAAYPNGDNGPLSGQVKVFFWSGSAWLQRGVEINGEASQDRSGYSISLSGDGNTLAIGARTNDGNGADSGHVRVFGWDGVGWQSLASDIDGEAAGDESGWSVSLSDDGLTLAVGARNNDGINGIDSGHVRVFRFGPPAPASFPINFGGGDNNTETNDEFVDAAGNLYQAGSFEGTVDFDPSAGGTAYLTSNGDFDAFITKFDSSGNLVWAQSFGSSSWDSINQITVDAGGNIVVAGSVSETLDLDPGAGVVEVNDSGSFVARFDSNGNALWASNFDGSAGNGFAWITELESDGAGDIFVGGQLSGSVDFDPGAGTNTLTASGAGDQDIFIAKLDNTGSFEWAGNMGGDEWAELEGITIGSTGRIYLSGTFSGVFDTNPGAGFNNLTAAGTYGPDWFTSTLDSSGAFLTAGKYPHVSGSGERTFDDLIVDASGAVITTGTFTGTVDFAYLAGQTVELTSGNGGTDWDRYIAKVNLGGTLEWAVNIDDPAKAGGTWNVDLTQDGMGNYLLAGHYYGSIDFDPGVGTTTLTASGDQDVFVSKFDGAGTFQWVRDFTFYSQNPQALRTYHPGEFLNFDGSGNLYLSTDFGDIVNADPVAATWPLVSADHSDLLTVKLNSAGGFEWAIQQDESTSQSWINESFVDSAGNTYITGYFEGTIDFAPSESGIGELSSVGGADQFVVKYDSSGGFLWGYPLGNLDDGAGNSGYYDSITVDNSGNVYAAGSNFSGTIDFDPGVGVANVTSGGYNDLFVTKFDANGDFVWVKTADSSAPNDFLSGGANVHKISADSAGNVVMVGSQWGYMDFDPGSAGGELPTGGASSSLFVARYAANGDLRWVERLGPPASPFYQMAEGGDARVRLFGFDDGFYDGDLTSLSDPSIATTAALATDGYSFFQMSDGDARVREFDRATGAFLGDVTSLVDPSVATTVALATDGNYFYQMSDGDARVRKFDRYTGAFLGDVTSLNDSSATTTTALATDGEFFYQMSAGDFRVRKFDFSGNFLGDLVGFDDSGLVINSEVLAIDPVGTQADFNTGYVEHIQFDAAGNVVIGGNFGGTIDFDPGAGEALITSVSDFDPFLVKLTGSGDLNWAGKFGGSTSSTDSAYLWDVTTDPVTGEVFAIGNFQGTVNFDPFGGTANLTSGPDGGDFLLRLDGGGTFGLVKNLSAEGDFEPDAIDFDSVTGSLLIAGHIHGTADVDPGPGVTNLTSAGEADIVVSQFDRDGNFIEARQIGGSFRDFASGVTVDASGELTITGDFEGTVDFDLGAGVTNRTSVGGDDLFVAKLDAFGSVGPSNVDISLTKTSNAVAVEQGGTVTYTVTVTGDAATEVTGATVADAFPDTLSDVDLTNITLNGGATTSATTGLLGGNAFSETVDLPAGSSVVYTFTATVYGANAIDQPVSVLLTNVATVTVPTGFTDADETNNAAHDSDLIVLATTGGSGVFTDSSQGLGSLDSRAVSLGDVDGDGDLDAFVANSDGGNKVWINDGSGTFTESSQSLGSLNSRSVGLGDVDGDGDLDAFVANFNEGNKVWLNDGSGVFTDTSQSLGFASSLGVSLGDIDGDGALDAFVVNNSHANKVWLNDGSGTFNDSGQSLTSSTSRNVRLGDFDGDGDLDAFVANFGSGNHVWLNDGSGTFNDSSQSLGSSTSRGVSLGDVDGDGDLDVFVANYNGEVNKIWLNDGSGTFSDSSQSLGSSWSQSVSLGDVDGDGDLDAFVANGHGDANKVWLNDGSGTFSDSNQGHGSSTSLGVSLGDLDGDGDLDAFVANFSAANRVWLNQNPGTLHWEGDVDSNWSTAGNWLENRAPIYGDTLVFDSDLSTLASVGITNNDLNGLTVGAIEIIENTSNLHSFSLTGNGFILVDGMSVTGADSQGGYLSLDGGEVLTLAGDQTFTYGIGSTLGPEIDTNGFVLTKSGGGKIFVNGAITGSGGFTVTGGQTYLNAANTYTGETNFVNGTIILQSSGSLGDSTGQTFFNGGTLHLSTAIENHDSITATGSYANIIGRFGAVQAGDVHLDSAPYIAFGNSNGGSFEISGQITGTTTDRVRFVPSASGSIIEITNPANDFVATTHTEVGGSNGGLVQLGASEVLPDGNDLLVSGAFSLNGFEETVGNLEFGPSAELTVNIGGAAAGTGAGFHDQLSANGTVTIDPGATLNLVPDGGFVPTAGDSFTVIDNDAVDAVSGVFAGLAEGATISNFLGSGLAATISYSGGDGNDVVIEMVSPKWSISGGGTDGEGVPANYTISLSGSFGSGDSASVKVALTDTSTNDGDVGSAADNQTDLFNAIAAVAGARSDLEFDAVTGVLTFTAQSEGAAMADVDFSLLRVDDGDVEGDEAFNISLSSVAATVTYSWSGFVEDQSGTNLWGIPGDGVNPVTDGAPFNLEVLVDQAAIDHLSGTSNPNHAQFEPLSVSLNIGGNEAIVSNPKIEFTDERFGALLDLIDFRADVTLLGSTRSFHAQVRLDGGTYELADVAAIDLPPIFSPTVPVQFGVSSSDGLGVAPANAPLSATLTGGNSEVASGADTVITTILNNDFGTTSVGLDGSNNLLIEDIGGDDTNDTLSIVVNGANYRIHDASNALIAGAGAVQVDANTVDVATSSITGLTGIIVDTKGGNDSLTVDYSGGDFVKAIDYRGGAGSDDLALTGGSGFAAATFSFANANDGSVDVTGNQTITYTGLEPIASNIGIGDLTLSYSGASETITVSDDAGAVAGKMTVDSSHGESVTFLNPTNSLMILAGDGDDTVDVLGFDSGFNVSLTIDGEESDDTVNLSAGVMFAPDHGLSVISDSIIGDAGAVFSASGIGAIDLRADDTIELTGAQLSTQSGGINVITDQFFAPHPSFGVDFGVKLDGTQLLTSTGGDIDIQALGFFGDSGVAILNNSTVTGGGVVNVIGEEGGFRAGVFIDSSFVDTVSFGGGDIAIRGAWGDSGVSIENNSDILSGGDVLIEGSQGGFAGVSTLFGGRIDAVGNIAIRGDQSTVGVYLESDIGQGGFATSQSVTIEGTSIGSGPGAGGVEILGIVNSGGDIDVTGTGGTGEFGVRVHGIVDNLGSGFGTVRLTGDGNDRGVDIASNAYITASNDLFIVGDAVDGIGVAAASQADLRAYGTMLDIRGEVNSGGTGVSIDGGRIGEHSGSSAEVAITGTGGAGALDRGIELTGATTVQAGNRITLTGTTSGDTGVFLDGGVVIDNLSAPANIEITGDGIARGVDFGTSSYVSAGNDLLVQGTAVDGVGVSGTLTDLRAYGTLLDVRGSVSNSGTGVSFVSGQIGEHSGGPAEVAITGTGGAGALDRGIELTGGANVGAANRITLTGTTSGDTGVFLDGGVVIDNLSAPANIEITGDGIARGVDFGTTSYVSAGNDLLVQGTAVDGVGVSGTLTDLRAYGTLLDVRGSVSNSGTGVSFVSGQIGEHFGAPAEVAITGTGGAGALDRGIELTGGANVGAGNRISLTGTTSGETGVFLDGVVIDNVSAPANIEITGDGTTRGVDFGTASWVSSGNDLLVQGTAVDGVGVSGIATDLRAYGTLLDVRGSISNSGTGISWDGGRIGESPGNATVYLEGTGDGVLPDLEITNFTQIDSEIDITTVGNGTLNAFLGGSGTYHRLGTGQLNFSGDTSMAGSHFIDEGTVVFTGAAYDPISEFVVASGATLKGTGTVSRVTLKDGATLAPGLSPGTLDSGDLVFEDNSNFEVEIGVVADSVNVTGGVTIGTGVTLSLSSFGGFVPSAGNSFVLINNDETDAVGGAFAGLSEGANIADFLGSGLNATITYQGGDGNDVVLSLSAANTAPVLAPIAAQVVDEGSPLLFTAVATDSDVPVQTLIYTLDQASLGKGMIIEAGSGAFSWIPGESQDGVHAVTVTVTDNGEGNLSDSEIFTITVNEVNQEPVLDAIGDHTVDEGDSLVFTATATDADLPTQNLSYSLDQASLSSGMSIDATSGSFSWTPGEIQDGDHTVTITVSDDGQGILSDFEIFTVTVNEVNQEPVLGVIGDHTVDEGDSLVFTATATDADLPAQNLTYSLDQASLSSGMSIDATSGAFSWTPIEGQSASNTVTVTVSDDGQGTLSDFEVFTVTVNEVNQEPVLGAIGDHTVDEGDPLVFTATATDADLPAQNLSYSLDQASLNSGMSIDAGSGAFSWTPGEIQDGDHTVTITVTDDGSGTLSDSETFTITVNELNQQPVLDPVGDLSVDEGTLLSFTASATDADLPIQTLTYSLDQASIDLGMSIHPVSGDFTWEPTQLQVGTHPVTVVVTDNGEGMLSDSKTFIITVNAVNEEPVLGAIADQVIDAKSQLTFTATATDPDLPAQVLTFSLDQASLNEGMAIDSTTGEFSWTPDSSHVGNQSVTVIVTDDGNLSDSRVVNIVVNAVDPIVSGPVTAGALEIDPIFTVDLLQGASDPNPGDVLTVVSLSVASGDDTGVRQINSTTLEIDPVEYRALAGGEQEVIVYTYEIEDLDGNRVSQTATITIEGINDFPIFRNLNAEAGFLIGQGGVVLDQDAEILDSEMNAANGGLGNYAGGLLRLQRTAGANSEDLFGFADMDDVTVVGNELQDSGGLAIATFTHSGGVLEIQFSEAAGAIPTANITNQILQALTYENTNPVPPSSLSIDYLFDDGGTVNNIATGDVTVRTLTPNSIQVTNGELLVAGDGEDDTIVLSIAGANLRIQTTEESISAGSGTAEAGPGDIFVPLAGLNAITVNSGGGTDLIEVRDLTGFSGAIDLNGGDGDDKVDFKANVTLAAGNHVTLSAEEIELFGADIQTSGTGNIFLDGGGDTAGNSKGINLWTSTLSALGTGSITVSGQGGLAGSSTQGIQLSGSHIDTADGDILLIGEAGGDGASNNGVSLFNGSSITAGGSGALQITGIGSSDGIHFGSGVFLANGSVLSVVDGDLTIDGTAGGVGSGSSGVQISGGDIIGNGAGNISISGTGSGTGGNAGVTLSQTEIDTTSGSGSIEVRGIGSVAAVSSSKGVNITGGRIETGGDGSVVVRGTGQGSGLSNSGVSIQTSASITTVGTGSIQIVGRGAIGTSSNDGVVIQTSSELNTVDGDLVVEGTAHGSGSNNRGVSILGASVQSSGSGNIRLVGAGATESITGSGNVGVNASSSTISANLGGLNITGNGGTGTSSNRGIYLNLSTVTTNASLTLVGRAHAATTGAFNIGTTISGGVLNGDSSSTIAGTGGGGSAFNHGVYMQNISGGYAGLTSGNSGLGVLSEDESGNFF